MFLSEEAQSRQSSPWAELRRVLCAACMRICKLRCPQITPNIHMGQDGLRKIMRAATVVGIYDLRLQQIKRCGRLCQRAVLALDCCPSVTRNVHPQVLWSTYHLRHPNDHNVYFVISHSIARHLRICPTLR